MLMTVTLASQHHSFIAIWIGSSLGMVIADGVAIAVGRILGAQLPERLVKFGAAAIFLATGVVTLIGAVTDKLG
jgi:putative Ca2+/H+ antiporter (TMEM165/GDT1 family)